jgi:ABC-2 type transport system ATP-binding protein
MEYVVESENLTKRYGSRQSPLAVNNLNLQIPPGILFGLVGPDGAGKTSTLRMLSTVMPASGGNVQVMGRDSHTSPDRIREQIGYMPQNFSQYPDLSLVENLSFFADIQQVPRDHKQARIDEMLRFTHLTEFKDRRAGALSGGMKKKLALACALIHEPQVLLLDEPSTGVDPVSRRELWVILARVVQGGATVIISTPYMDEADRCHRVGILYQGQIVAQGTPEELKGHLPFDVLEVKASPRKIMRQVVTDTPGVLDWRPVGDSLRITVQSGAAGQVLCALEERFRQQPAQVKRLRQVRHSMEDVFVYQVSQQRQEQRGRA